MDEHTLNVEQLNNPKKCIKNSQVFTESFKCIASQKISYVSFGIPSLPHKIDSFLVAFLVTKY